MCSVNSLTKAIICCTYYSSIKITLRQFVHLPTLSINVDFSSFWMQKYVFCCLLLVAIAPQFEYSSRTLLIFQCCSRRHTLNPFPLKCQFRFRGGRISLFLTLFIMTFDLKEEFLCKLRQIRTAIQPYWAALYSISTFKSQSVFFLFYRAITWTIGSSSV